MYAVGKVLYTVASPFHPFGGAVDIVVVQQQDGSFKSSPWYVRFGKFQGVLKTTEKAVVSVAVNGAEAGFHMYLDSNGEAHFLRDADSNNIEEGDLVASSLASSPGDRREAPVMMMQDAQLRKSKSTSCDVSAMEPNVGDGGKVLATRTMTRRSTILERMFGRKSVKEEEAHVAAQLLDTKWSTSLSSDPKACGSKDEPSSSSHVTADAGDGDQTETTKMVLPDCSFDHEKTMGSNGDVDNSGSQHGRWSPGYDNEDCVQNTSVKEEIVEIYEGKRGDLTNNGITSTTEQPRLESLSNDLGTDGRSMDGSDDNQTEPHGNSEEVTGREIRKKEVLSCGMYEIHAMETDITNEKSEAVSQFVVADLDRFNQKFTHTYSPTYSTTNLSSERHHVSDGITSTIDPPGPESSSNDPGTNKSINVSIDIQAELQGNCQDVTTTEMHIKEVLSHVNFEIHAIKTNVTNGKSQAISQFVVVDSDGDDEKITHAYSPTYTDKDLPSERHDVSYGVTSTTDQPCSESLSHGLDTNKSMIESIDIKDELRGNSEDFTRGLCTKEVLSHGLIDIRATKMCIANGESEAVSQFVATDLDGFNQNFTHTYSATYNTINFLSERHDVSDRITSRIDLLGSKSWSNDLGTDKSINVSIDIQGEWEGNSEDVTTTEMHKKEVLSHDNFEIHAIETDITNEKSKLISHLVVVDSHGVDQNFTHTYSPTYINTDLSSEKHDIFDGVTSTQDQLGSKSLSHGMGIDKSTDESIDIQGELRDNSEDFTSEIYTKEVLSHGFFEIQAIETGITNTKSEAVSRFVATDLDGFDQNFAHTNSPTCSIIHLSSEKHDVSDGVASVTDMPRSEYLSNGLSTDKTIGESIGVEGELRGNSEDVTGRKICTKEVLSHGIFGIHAIETDITNAEREMTSQFVVIHSDEVHQNFTHTNSATYNTIDLSSERNDVSLNACSLDACQDKVVIMSSSETVERSYDVSGTLLDVAGISLADGVQSKECSRVSSEKIEQITFKERPLSYHGTSSNKEDTCNLEVRDQEVSIFEDSSPQVSQANVLDKDISADTITNDHIMCSTHGSDIDIFVDIAANDHSTYSTHDLACHHDLVFRDASSNDVEVLSNMHENDPDDITKDYAMETKTCNEEHYVFDIQTSRMEDANRECIAQIANFPYKVDDGFSPINSDVSSLSKVKIENIKLESDNRSSFASGVEIGFVSEEPRDEAKPVDSFSKFVEEIQFQFSDTGSFSNRNTSDDVISNKAAGARVHDGSNDDPDEQGGGVTSLEDKLENCSDLSRPGSELHLSDNNLEAKSLPNPNSHIHDLERSNSFQLSSSLQYNGENNGVDPTKIKNSRFLEQEPEGTGDSKENSSTPEHINDPEPDDKHADDLKVDSFNPFAELSLCKHLLSEGMGADAACKAFDAEKITLDKFCAMKRTLITNNKLVVRIKGRYFPWDVAAPVVLGMVSYREEQVFEPQGMIKVERVEPRTTQGGSWRIWPFSFRRTRTINVSQPIRESTVESSLTVHVKESVEERNKPEEKSTERKVRSLTPTCEELSSLDLKEGRNMVTFTFSTAMLGRQQVDAHIYVWKWNARIVISDVDGTITKSDVLGQFMPMVGVDWSQTGVAHLFSAIKENGYQLLFLSARSISQAHLTRQFLFNLQQDGKMLPDGPVVISPDGLFPSLYREVIRRAPHEFKISCLAVIKALFPPDSNPFYAGFGNRDTDEFSYLKVGIPMGKIFIINPKGEVAVNHRVDTKSYTSLHALVNGMFPPILSSSEQEDYNTWNYWKMPLPTVNI